MIPFAIKSKKSSIISAGGSHSSAICLPLKKNFRLYTVVFEIDDFEQVSLVSELSAESEFILKSERLR